MFATLNVYISVYMLRSRIVGSYGQTSLPGLRRFRHDSLVTLGIETSCDDTSVAIVEKYRALPRAVIHFHKKITSDNSAFKGVHPLQASKSHQENLANVVAEAIRHLPYGNRKPNCISVTRGPGMRTNLYTGIDTAKGLAVAWQVPLIGVHHMQAHALTSRLVASLQPFSHSGSAESRQNHEFPFLSVLVSGGHTMLIHSVSLTEHRILGSTLDTAIGESLDKIARLTLPSALIQNVRNAQYGALLEDYAFAKGGLQSEESTQSEALVLESGTARQYLQRLPEDIYSQHFALPPQQRITEWGWVIEPPLTRSAGGYSQKSLDLSFSGLASAVERIVRFPTDKSTGRLGKVERPPEDVGDRERRTIAREAMRAAFEHLASRAVRAIQQSLEHSPEQPLSTIVMSGGAAANGYLRYLLAQKLCMGGQADARIVFPPVSLCTDNAAMIAWTGLEMFEAGFSDPLTIRAIKRWPLDKLLCPPAHEC